MDALYRDWQELPLHIVDLLVLKIDSFSDYLHISWVCPQWRHVALESNADHKINLDVLKETCCKLPLLVFNTDKKFKSQKIYSISDGKTYTVKLPLPYNKRFAGSSFGWLFYVEETLVITLANPYNNSCISLPVFEDPHKVFQVWRRNYVDYYITKGIILSDPLVCPDSFVVVVIYGVDFKMAFFRAGESSWNVLDTTAVIVEDIVNYKGKLYGVALEGTLVQIDLYGGTFEVIILGEDRDFSLVPEAIYLLESQDGELFMVERRWIQEAYDENYVPDENPSLEAFPNTYRFKVFKMSNPIEEGPATWVEINDIGQQALFLGDNHSASVSTINFPRCFPNSIYYTSQHHREASPYFCQGPDEDCGIFSLEHNNICNHHVLGSSDEYMQPLIWLVPNPGEIN